MIDTVYCRQNFILMESGVDLASPGVCDYIKTRLGQNESMPETMEYDLKSLHRFPFSKSYGSLQNGSRTELNGS